MKGIRKVFVVALLVLTVGFVACSQGAKTENSSQAIEQAKKMENAEQQIKFLVQEANGFVNSEKFDEGIKTAKYILSNLDKESEAAKGIIETAKAEIEAMAKEKAEEAKAALKKKMENFGN